VCIVCVSRKDTYTELDWDGEKVTASLLCNSLTALDTWEVDVGWLYNAGLALGCLENLLGEAVQSLVGVSTMTRIQTYR